MAFATVLGEGLLAWAIGLCVLGSPHQAPQSLPGSALPFELVGVGVDTATPSRSACLIHCTYPFEKTATFHPGQTAFDFAEIKEIREDGVVLRNLLTNRLEVLMFLDNQPRANMPPPPQPTVTTSSDLVTIDLPREALSRYLTSLPELLESALAKPRYREGKTGPDSVEGFEISKIKEAGIVSQLGLRDGDVLLDVNGTTLDSLATVIRLLAEIQTMPQAKMTVLRTGRTLHFVLNRR